MTGVQTCALPIYARTLADEAVAKLYHHGLFRGHPAKPYYEAVDGVGILLYALVQLGELLHDPDDAIKQGAIRLSAAEVMTMDNW